MTIYYSVRRNKYRGDMVIVYDSDKPFHKAISMLNKAKVHDVDKAGLANIVEGDTFIGPGGVVFRSEDNPILWFTFALPRESTGIEPMKSDKTLKELQKLADQFDKAYKAGGIM